MEKLEKEVQLLADVSRAIADSLNLEETLRSILSTLETHLKLERGQIMLLDPDTETIGIRVAHGLSDESRQVTYKVGEGITGLVVQKGVREIVPDITKDPRFLAKTGRRPKPKRGRIAFLCVPIKLEGKTIGAISADRKVLLGENLESYVHLLEILSTMVAQAVKLNRLVLSDRLKLEDENARLRSELKKKFSIHNMIGTSNAMQEVYRLIE